MGVRMSEQKVSIDVHVNKCKESGLTVAEYSRRYDVSRWTLYERLSRERKNKVTRKPVTKAVTTPVARFIELSPLPSRPSPIHLLFPTGIEVTLSPGFDSLDLRNLVSGLCWASGAGKPC